MCVVLHVTKMGILLITFCRTNDQDAVNVPPPRWAVGVVSLLDHIPPPRSLTCILCQEESKDTSSQEKPFVQAVHIQRSAVLRRGQNNDEGICECTHAEVKGLKFYLVCQICERI